MRPLSACLPLFSLIFYLGSCSGGAHVPVNTPTKETILSPMQESLRSYITELEEAYQCRIGLAFNDPESGLEFSHRGDELFHAASTMKVPVMIEVFRRADAADFSLQDTINAYPFFESMIDGSPYKVDPRDELSRRLNEDVPILILTEQMIVVSDNLATNLLITRLTPQRITATMRTLGANDGFVVRCLMDEQAYQANMSNLISARDLNTLMGAIARNQAASPEACAEMRRILLDQRYNEMIPARLPEGVRVAHKTGNITGISHDTAIVSQGNKEYYLTILTEDLSEGETTREEIAELARTVHTEWLKALEGTGMP